MSFEYEYEYGSQSAHEYGRGGTGVSFGAVPPELTYGPLTLQFALGLNAPATHPAVFPLLPPPNPLPQVWPGGWDTNLYSLFAFTEFVEQAPWRAFTTEVLPMGGNPTGVSLVNLQWQPALNANWVAFITSEITLLSQFMAQERERYMSEIVAQHDGAPGYWIALLNLEKSRYPWTLRLISLATRVGELVVMHAKLHFLRPRPSHVSPALMPPFGPPAHPSFPSGHSTQSWLTARCLGNVTRGPVAAAGLVSRFANQINWLANRIALNREFGGFHFPSDTAAGREMADHCFDALLALADNPAVPAPFLRDIFTGARAEWP